MSDPKSAAASDPTDAPFDIESQVENGDLDDIDQSGDGDDDDGSDDEDDLEDMT